MKAVYQAYWRKIITNQKANWNLIQSSLRNSLKSNFPIRSIEKIAKACADSGRPITLVLDNARYQKCQSVANKANQLNIELLYLPPYSPNLNLIERLWRFVKKQVLYSKHYERFDTFRNSINNCISDLDTRFKSEMQSLMTMNFQLF